MPNPTSRFSFRLALARTLATFAMIAALATLATAPLFADDRDILRQTTTKPYLFVILDTSGSMNWAPKCSATDFAAGTCDFLCPTGDCAVPRDGDDPASKFHHQGRSCGGPVDDHGGTIDLGFATYNSDDLGVQNKHWLSKVSATQPAGFFSLSGSVPFPIAGAEEVFGSDWWGRTEAYLRLSNRGCERWLFSSQGRWVLLPNTGDCGSNGNVCNPADANNAWDYTRFGDSPALTAPQTTPRTSTCAFRMARATASSIRARLPLARARSLPRSRSPHAPTRNVPQWTPRSVKRFATTGSVTSCTGTSPSRRPTRRWVSWGPPSAPGRIRPLATPATAGIRTTIGTPIATTTLKANRT